MLKILCLVTFLISFSGCTHAVHSYHVAERIAIPKGTTVKTVHALKSQFVVLGFVTQTDFVDAAYSEIQKKCKGGAVTGINTRYSTSHAFLSWTNKVKMTGYCVSKGT